MGDPKQQSNRPNGDLIKTTLARPKKLESFHRPIHPSIQPSIHFRSLKPFTEQLVCSARLLSRTELTPTTWKPNVIKAVFEQNSAVLHVCIRAHLSYESEVAESLQRELQMIIDQAYIWLRNGDEETEERIQRELREFSTDQYST